MLSKPVLANCANRAKFAPTHPIFGEPDQWMTSANLAPIGLSSISFDFFVDWSANPLAVGNELWVKRIAQCRVADIRLEDVHAGAIACGDDLQSLSDFAARYGFDARYTVFQDGVDWLRAPERIAVATLRGGTFASGAYRTLERVKSEIRQRSGGPVRMGTKGLTFGTSSLECYLSTTDALWPGDADCVLWSAEENRAVALLEFKKHTLDSPLDDENIRKYMHRDRRKWKRLGLLRDRISAPLICVYYSTSAREDRLKIEWLEGKFDALDDSRSQVQSISGMSHADIAQAIAQAVMG